MRLHRARILVALLLCLTPLVSAQRAMAWFCEGRPCGTDLGCCCIAPSGARHASCGLGVTAVTSGSACTASCNCVLVLSSDHPSARSVPQPAVPSLLALLPRVLIALDVPPAAEKTFRGRETRGPPVASACLTNPALRAPPSSWRTPFSIV